MYSGYISFEMSHLVVIVFARLSVPAAAWRSFSFDVGCLFVCPHFRCPGVDAFDPLGIGRMDPRIACPGLLFIWTWFALLAVVFVYHFICCRLPFLLAVFDPWSCVHLRQTVTLTACLHCPLTPFCSAYCGGLVLVPCLACA
jgi:hypothetical protein